MPKISFSFQQPVTLRSRKLLKDFIGGIFKHERRELGELNIIFCTDDYLLDINRTFLNHDYLTDIITFDLSDKSASLAEIYISIDRVRENASKLNISFQVELLRVMFHGVLHLAGYKDKKPQEKTAMRKKEDHYLKRYSSKVPRGTGINSRL